VCVCVCVCVCVKDLSKLPLCASCHAVLMSVWYNFIKDYSLKNLNCHGCDNRQGKNFPSLRKGVSGMNCGKRDRLCSRWIIFIVMFIYVL